MLQKLTAICVDMSNKHKKMRAVQQETGVTKTARFSVSKLFRSFQVKLAWSLDKTELGFAISSGRLDLFFKRMYEIGKAQIYSAGPDIF